MSEISDDYLSNPNVHRWRVRAKAAKLTGSGMKAAYAWVMSGVFPDEIIDSDNSKASNAGPTMRIAADAVGIDQRALHQVDFTQASGGYGGGATDEVWIEAGSVDFGTYKDFWVFWITGGSQTQPAAGATYGADEVYAGIEFISHDGGLTDSSANHHSQTDTGTANTTTAKIGASAREHGAGDSMETPVDMDDATTGYTWMSWGRNTDNNGRYIMAQWESTGIGFVVFTGAGDGVLNVWFDNTALFAEASFFTLNTWKHWAATYNSTSGYAVYGQGASLDTDATTTFPNFASCSEGVYIGNRTEGSREWLGQIDEPIIIKATLDGDQIAALYQNQNDPSDFWDTTAAVEDGPFGDIPSYEWSFQGREYSWTGSIFKSGFTGDTTTVCAGSEMRLTWGERTNTLDDRIRAAELKFSLVDPNLTVYNDLSDTTLDEDDWYMTLVDSTGVYSMKLKIRLDEVSTLLVDDLEEHVTEIYAYCGMAEFQNIDAVTLSSSTLHNLFRLCLVSNAVAQDIEYISNHYAENIASTGAYLDLMRLNRLDLIFAEEGRKVDTMYDQMRSMMEGFQLFVMNGLDGQWHVKNEIALGETVNTRAAQFYDYSEGTLVTLPVAGDIFTLSDRIIGRDTMKRPLKGVQALQVDRGNSRDFFTVDLVRHGDYENGWISSSEHEVWTAVEGSYSQSSNADTGSYSFALTSTSNRADQKLARMAGGEQDIDVEVALRYAKESTSASTTQSGTSFLVLFYKNDTTTDTERGDPGGTWSAAVNSITLDAGLVANGDSLVWTTLITTIYGPLPAFDGNMIISKQSSFANFTTYFDTLEVRLKTGAGATSKFRAVTGRYDLISGDLIGKGEVVEQRIPWYNALLGIDVTDDGTRDDAIPMIQVLTTAAGDWVQASDFRTLTFGYTGTDYADPFELVGTIRIDQQNVTTEEIEGEALGIVPHDYVLKYNDNSYIQVYTSIDLRREVTEFVAHKKIIGATSTFGEEVLTFLWWSYNESGATVLPENGICKSVIPEDVDTVPWETDTEPSDKLIINISDTTVSDVVLHVRADRTAELLFYTGDTTDTLYYSDLDGNSPTDTGVTAWGLSLLRVSELLCIYDLTTFKEYDYSSGVPVFSRNLFTRTSTLAGAPGYDQSGTYMFIIVVGESSADFIKRITLSDLSTTNVTTITSLGIGNTDTCEICVDEEAGYIFFLISASAFEIYRVDYPGGANLTTIKTTGVGRGMTLDRVNQKILFSNGVGDAQRMDYDGSNAEEVYTYTSNIRFYAMDTGLG